MCPGVGDAELHPQPPNDTINSAAAFRIQCNSIRNIRALFPSATANTALLQQNTARPRALRTHTLRFFAARQNDFLTRTIPCRSNAVQFIAAPQWSASHNS